MWHPIETAPRNGILIEITNYQWFQSVTFAKALSAENPIGEDAWLLAQGRSGAIPLSRCDATHWRDVLRETGIYDRNFRIEQVSPYKPESYAAYNDFGRTIGYFRLEDGVFTVEAMHADGRAEIIHMVKAAGEHAFLDEEREGHLAAARSALSAVQGKHPGRQT